LVNWGDAEFFVELLKGNGPRTVGLDGALSFEGVRNTLRPFPAARTIPAW
jgi:hypothetical protein